MKLKHWITIGIFIAITALLVLFAANLLRMANARDNSGVYGFYLEPEDSLDTVMIGASTIYTSFYPPLAYEQEGFTSYMLATSDMPGSLYRYAAELAIERQHPQLLVFEVFGFCYKDEEEETRLRKFIDSMPDSELRTRIIKEIVPEELKTSFYHPFEKYHSNWNRLDKCIEVMLDKISMKLRGYSVTKSFSTRLIQADFTPMDKYYVVTEEGLYYLNILLDYLKTADIENVLFLRTPEMNHYEETDSYYQMLDLISEAGFDYLDLSDSLDDLQIDVNHDFYNTSHLNIFGAEKYTSYFSSYIMEQYNLDTGNHDKRVIDEWNNCQSYNPGIINGLKKLTEDNVRGVVYSQNDFIHKVAEQNLDNLQLAEEQD